MNRFAKVLVSAATIATGLAGVPAIASAQVVNVAPPAYAVPAPPPPPAQPASYAVGRDYREGDHGYESRGGRWEDQRARERWEREHREYEHMRECEVASAQGASWWTLAWMRCPMR
jgi:hypothetical protein